MATERLNRQLDLLVPTDLDIHIVGCGGIGSWTALALAKMGYERITLYDFDNVEDHNIATQFYDVEDIGKRKTEALATNIENFSGVKAVAINSRPDGIKGDVLIMAVDSMKSRAELAKLIPNFQFVIDGRMGGLVANIFSFMPFEKDRYEATLFTDEEAAPEPCTARAICFNVFSIAGMIGNMVKRFDRGEAMPFETNLDMVNIKTYTTKF
jgi:threonine dehydrogenase-like Zn-dependent dehydrogenase